MSRVVFDAHNHLQDKRLAEHLPALLRTLPSSGVTRCVVNGTSPDDWPAVATLARTHPGLVLPSFGLHPWFLAGRDADWLSLLSAFLTEFPHAGVGECGLDRWIPGHDTDDQRSVFLAQLDLATRLNRPLSIHCLQAWGPLLDCLRDHPLPKRGFLLHSYGGSAEMVPAFTGLGAYFSFSGYFLEPRKEKARAAFREVPAERLLLESDAPDMLPPEPLRIAPLAAPDGTPLNNPANLPAIAEALAILLGLPPEILLERSNRNFTRLFD